MSEISSPNDPDGTERFAEDAADSSRPRGRRTGRIVLISVLSVFAVLGAAIAGIYIAVDHLTGNIQRIPNVFNGLNAAARPVPPTGKPKSMTVLLTGQSLLRVVKHGNGELGSSGAKHEQSGLVMLLHLNDDGKSAAVVSIPGNTIVAVPGHRPMQLENTPAVGGPALLINTVEQLTNVRIDHYSVIDFPHVSGVIDALGGVDVTLPGPASSQGITFHAGINHMNGKAALAYARQPVIAASDVGRTLRQQNLLRAVLSKLSNQHLLTNPVTSYQVLNAVTHALSVDSDFSNAELRSLVLRLRDLNINNGTFVTAPTHPAGTEKGQPVVRLDTPESDLLWLAIRNDSVAAFAKRYPATVTSLAPR
jgi:LCP family protein required for cell wall assembly